MMISESFSYVLLAGIVGTLVAATLGMTLLRAFVENGPTSMMMTFQITLLPALIMLILFWHWHLSFQLSHSGSLTIEVL